MTLSRIEGSTAPAGAELVRLDDPRDLPPPSEVALVVVDWSERRDDWGASLRGWRDSAAGARPRIVLFGPHTDLAAHAAARQAGLGPMQARSAFFAALPGVLAAAMAAVTAAGEEDAAPA